MKLHLHTDVETRPAGRDHRRGIILRRRRERPSRWSRKGAATQAGNGRMPPQAAPVSSVDARRPAHAAALARSRAGRARRPAARQQHLGHRRRSPAADGFLPARSPADLRGDRSSFPRERRAERCRHARGAPRSKGQEEETGGLAYLAGLARDTPTADNIRAYADIVRERSLLRQLIRVSGEIAASAYENEGTPARRTRRRGRTLRFPDRGEGPRQGSGFVPVREVLGATIDRLDLLHASQGQLTGLSTGYTELDKMTAGLQPGDLVIVAGRPSMGKTTLRAQHRRERGDRGRTSPSRSSRWKCRASSSRSA